MNSRPKQIALRILPVFLALTLLVAGCGASYRDEADYGGTAASTSPGEARDYNGLTTGGYTEMAVADDAFEYGEYDMADMEMPAEAAQSPATGGGGESYEREIAAQERKIVYTVDLNLETKEFDDGVAFILDLTEEFGGYVQSSSLYGSSIYESGGGARWSRHSVRVPAERLDEFVGRLSEQFNVTYNNRYTDDITDSYYDVQAHIDSLQIALAQLEAMLEQAEELEYLIEVQRELTSVRYQLESLLAARNRMDSQVSMSTVHISLDEVLEYQPQAPIDISFSERVSLAFSNGMRGFARFWENFVLGAVEALPFLLIALVVIIVLVVVILRRRRRLPANPPVPPAVPTPPEAPSQQHPESTETAQKPKQAPEHPDQPGSN